MHIATLIDEMQAQADIYICEQETDAFATADQDKPRVLLIGPEGGWSDQEKALFQEKQLRHIALNDLTLRAETAAVVAVAKMMA
jgi:RsmE family RNA methyltransferase